MQATPRRYYTEKNAPNPELNQDLLHIQMHALFCQWVQSHFHRRDFVSAVGQESSMLLIDYLMAGQPELSASDVPEVPTLSLTPSRQPSEETLSGPRLRYYDEEGELNHRVSSEYIRKGLAALFCKWVAEGWLARDFLEAARDMATTVTYEYELACSLGGLGGSKTGPEYLANPYVPPPRAKSAE